MRRWKRDDGIALAWLAVTLVLLIGMAGFGVDLGWIYLNTARAQKAVDAAALAGVVNLPGFITQATIDAEDATVANGFDPAGLTVTPLADNKLHAELGIRIEPFFLSVLGFDHFDISREAIAEYIKPVPLGNPNNYFGDGLAGDSWAAISSQFIHKEHGDPYSTQCRVPSSPSSCASGNSDHNRGGAYAGYYYGVEVFGTSSDLTVDLFDAMFNGRPQDVETGDFAFSGSNGPITTYTLHRVDNTPLDPTDNVAIPGCSLTLDPDDGNSYQYTWRNLCAVNGSLIPGIYVLHVTTTGDGIASNHYSVRAEVASGPQQPRVYGINDMSIWSNDLVQNSELYIAEIDDIHAGKKLELQFYDPGDADADSFMTLLSPNGPVTCSWTVWNHNLTAQTQPAQNNQPCAWQTTDTSLGSDPRVYNEQWIVAVIDLPDDPAAMCNGSDCFWKMQLNLSQPTERTTWRARVIGNPVHLVPPETSP